jgi:superfamily II DNA/RNA helicase
MILITDCSYHTQVAPMLMILSPTRELAQQIAVEASSLSTFHKFSVVTLVGK